MATDEREVAFIRKTTTEGEKGTTTLDCSGRKAELLNQGYVGGPAVGKLMTSRKVLLTIAVNTRRKSGDQDHRTPMSPGGPSSLPTSVTREARRIH